MNFINFYKNCVKSILHIVQCSKRGVKNQISDALTLSFGAVLFPGTNGIILLSGSEVALTSAQMEAVIGGTT